MALAELGVCTQVALLKARQLRLAIGADSPVSTTRPTGTAA
jgi:hypothetical protein